MDGTAFAEARATPLTLQKPSQSELETLFESHDAIVRSRAGKKLHPRDCDLRGLDLSGRALESCNFKNADLSGALVKTKNKVTDGITPCSCESLVIVPSVTFRRHLPPVTFRRMFKCSDIHFQETTARLKGGSVP
jgi:uncharacterized protein YjbI with pentapeptide repeats